MTIPLLRQGFKTQIWVWHARGPSPLYVGAMARDFFEETHVSILAVNASEAERAYKNQKDKIMYGKYALVGHIEDTPLTGEVYARPMQTWGAVADDSGLATLNRMKLAGSLALGYWWSDPEAHGLVAAESCHGGGAGGVGKNRQATTGRRGEDNGSEDRDLRAPIARQVHPGRNCSKV